RSRRVGSVGDTHPSTLARAVRVDELPRRFLPTSSRPRPPPHLAQARLLVVRDALEDLEGCVALVSAFLQGGDVPLQVDRPLSEGKVLVPRLSLTTVIVVDVRETESVPQDREVLPRAVGPLVEVGMPHV